MAKKRQFTLTLILILFALFLIAQTCSSPVTFDSDPQGANVYVDGSLKGVTPVIISVAGGQRTIKYSLSGYEDLTFQIQVLGAQEVSKALTPIGQCQDLDADGYGSPASASCQNAELDCNDNNAAVNPRVSEICTDGIDNDCDGAIDSGDSACAACPDNDGDSYCAYEMASGAVFAMTLDSKEGTIFRETFGNDGDCQHNLYGCPDIVGGVIGGAAQFNGYERILLGKKDAFNFPGDFSVAFRIKTTGSGFIVGSGEQSGAGSVWRFTVSYGKILFHFNTDNGGFGDSWSDNIIADGVWHTVVFTRAGNENSLYVDGVLNDFAKPTASPITPTYETAIGMDQLGIQKFTGAIDEIEIYQRALTEAEVQRISAVRDYDCDDGNTAVYPGALEECFDGLDKNCDGNLDCMDSQCSAKPECICSESGDVRCYQNLAQFCGQGLWATLDLCSENEDCYLIEPSQLEILPGVPVGIGSIAGCSDKVSLSANGAGNNLGGVKYVSGTPLGDPSCFTIGEEYVSYSDTCPPLTGEYHVTMQSQTERTEPPPIIVNHGGGWEVCEECTILSTTQDSFTFQVSGFSKWSTPTRRSCESGTDATCSCAKNDVGCENGVATKVSDIKKELIRSSTIDFYRCTFLQSTRNCDSDETCGSGDCVCDPAKACPADCSGECVDTNGNECLDKCNECISCDSDPDPCPNQKCTPVSACDVECEPCPVCSPSECGVNQGCTGEDADGCSVCGPCPTGVCGGCSPDKCFDQNGDGCKDTCCPRVPCGNPGNKFCCFDPALPKCDMTLSTPACVPNCEAGDTSCTDMCCSTPTRWGCDIRGWDRCSPCDSEFGWQCEPPNRCCTGVTDRYGGWCCDPNVDSCRDGTYGPKCKWTG